MNKATFEVGHEYVGEFFYSGETRMKVIKRTEKTITVVGYSGKPERKKIQNFGADEHIELNCASFNASNDTAKAAGKEVIARHADDWMYN